MIGTHEESRTIETGPDYQQHWRTHKRRVAAVLVLYGSLVSIGIIATVVHRSNISEPSRPDMSASLGKAAR